MVDALMALALFGVKDLIDVLLHRKAVVGQGEGSSQASKAFLSRYQGVNMPFPYVDLIRVISQYQNLPRPCRHIHTIHLDSRCSAVALMQF